MFDINDFTQIRKNSRKIALSTLETNIHHLLRKAGLREIDHNYQNGDRNLILQSHGFRKFWLTQAVNSKMNPEQREMLQGRKIALASAYYRPSESDMLDAYLVAINELTINEENRVRTELDALKEESNEVSMMRKQMMKMEDEAKRSNLQHKMDRLESMKQFHALTSTVNKLNKALALLDSDKKKEIVNNQNESEILELEPELNYSTG